MTATSPGAYLHINGISNGARRRKVKSGLYVIIKFKFNMPDVLEPILTRDPVTALHLREIQRALLPWRISYEIEIARTLIIDGYSWRRQ